MEKKKHPGGRPTKYKPEYARMAYKHCLLGATDKELADLFEVEEKTINNWKAEFPEFLQALKAGKDDADAEVATKLYYRAKGYSHPEDKIFLHEGQPVIVATEKHYPPDTGAAIFWMKNRQRQKWRDVSRQELTGKDGTPLVTGKLEDFFK